MTNTENGTVTVSRYIKTSTIAEMYALGRGTTFRITKDPTFPEPVVLPGGHHRYPADEVAAWFEARRERPAPRAVPKPGTLNAGPVIRARKKAS